MTVVWPSLSTEEQAEFAAIVFGKIQGAPGLADLTKERTLDYLTRKGKKDPLDGFTAAERLSIDGVISRSKLDVSFKPAKEKVAPKEKVSGGLESSPLERVTEALHLTRAPPPDEPGTEPLVAPSDPESPNEEDRVEPETDPLDAPPSTQAEGGEAVRPSMTPEVAMPVPPAPAPVEVAPVLPARPPVPEISATDDAMLAFLDEDEKRSWDAMVVNPVVIERVDRVARMVEGSDRNPGNIGHIAGAPRQVVERILADTKRLSPETQQQVRWLSRQVDPLTNRKFTSERIAKEFAVNIEAVSRLIAEMPPEAPPPTVRDIVPPPPPPVVLGGQRSVEEEQDRRAQSEQRREKAEEEQRAADVQRRRLEDTVIRQDALLRREKMAREDVERRLHLAMSDVEGLSRAIRTQAPPKPTPVPAVYPVPSLEETAQNARRLEVELRGLASARSPSGMGFDSILVSLLVAFGTIFAFGVAAFITGQAVFPTVGSAGLLFLSLIPLVFAIVWGMARMSMDAVARPVAQDA